MRIAPASDRLFYLVFGALTLLAAAPFWLTDILPMQDYSQFLLIARAWGDSRDPTSPFHGAYTVGFPLSPLLLPILLVRALGAVAGLEAGGRVMWTLYAAGLPAASLYLLRVLGRDRWAGLLVFPIVISYWVTGGFFAFATAAPLFVLGLAVGVRWLSAPTWWRGVAFGAIACALQLWHALVFAQLLFDFGVLWLLVRGGDLRARVVALAPLVPSLLLFAAWILSTVHGRAPGTRPALWAPPLESLIHMFSFVGPIVPGASIAAILVMLVVATGGLAEPRSSGEGPFRVASPFAWLALLAVISFLVFPMTCFGVEGIANRQPWIAALLFVFGWNLPARPALRVALLSLVGAAGAIVLAHLAGRFAAFERESGGASRLIDRLGPGDTLLAAVGAGSTTSFPGKPLLSVDLYASIRHGGLPNSSFAGYDILIVRYVDDQNPMPGLGPGWIDDPELSRFDYVLLRGPTSGTTARAKVIRPLAEDAGWALYAVCGSKTSPQCP